MSSCHKKLVKYQKFQSNGGLVSDEVTSGF